MGISPAFNFFQKAAFPRLVACFFGVVEAVVVGEEFVGERCAFDGLKVGAQGAAEWHGGSQSDAGFTKGGEIVGGGWQEVAAGGV